MVLIRTLNALCCVAAGVMVAACGSFQMPTKKIDYKSAGKIPSLEVPPDLARPSADDRYVVPDARKGTATFSNYNTERDARPQVSSGAVLPEQNDARIERAGTQRWLVVKGDPAQVWPVVKDFWQEIGFIINIEIPDAGVMETDWAENRAKLPDGIIRGALGKLFDSIYSTSERDKFRTRLERGMQSGTTEVYVSHRGMQEVYITEGKDQTRWHPRPVDPDLEAEMLRRMMTRFGVQEAQAKQRIAAAAQAPRAALASQSGGVLTVNEQFDRAWRRVGLALDRVGFTVEDRDRSKGIYFVRYIDPESDVESKKDGKGLIGRTLGSLKFWGGSPAKKNEQFQIAVRDMNTSAQVSVLNKDGKQEQSATANRILTLLHDQLK
ncbi:MAG: outer membrane protein assembly factor BamC [Betaproteobacteria bacterium]|nr:outer membrane protein assembly factor BamC [Betaproteobacteria bacterium]